jgi:hypothetical protein
VRQAEVGDDSADLGLVVFRRHEDDVAWLEVAVDDPARCAAVSAAAVPTSGSASGSHPSSAPQPLRERFPGSSSIVRNTIASSAGEARW